MARNNEMNKDEYRMMHTFMAVTQPKILFRNSRSVIPNRFDEPNEMAPTAPSETAK